LRNAVPVTVAASGLLFGCVTSQKIQVVQPGDQNLSCNAIKEELAKLSVWLMTERVRLPPSITTKIAHPDNTIQPLAPTGEQAARNTDSLRNTSSRSSRIRSILQIT
jgi:hypothetical protein